MTTSSAVLSRRYPGRLFLVLGLALPVLGLMGYAVQMAAQRLMTPWYVPITATLGLAFLIASLGHARTVWRVLALLLVTLLAGATWMFLLAMRLPAYTGPVAVGQPFPAFETTQADGTPFTRHDLKSNRTNVLVFFRGRW